ncbi:MAG: carboxypeptidase-like regulatory domain-containing protein [Flavobacteriales bacterium]
MLLCATTICAQSDRHYLYILQGHITDGFTGEPIPFARIEVAASMARSGMTDFDGFYLLRPNVPPGRYAVRFSAEGYVPRTDTIEILRDRAVIHDVKLPSYPR